MFTFRPHRNTAANAASTANTPPNPASTARCRLPVVSQSLFAAFKQRVTSPRLQKRTPTTTTPPPSPSLAARSPPIIRPPQVLLDAERRRDGAEKLSESTWTLPSPGTAPTVKPSPPPPSSPSPSPSPSASSTTAGTSRCGQPSPLRLFFGSCLSGSCATRWNSARKTNGKKKRKNHSALHPSSSTLLFIDDGVYYDNSIYVELDEARRLAPPLPVVEPIISSEEADTWAAVTAEVEAAFQSDDEEEVEESETARPIALVLPSATTPTSLPTSRCSPTSISKGMSFDLAQLSVDQPSPQDDDAEEEDNGADERGGEEDNQDDDGAFGDEEGDDEDDDVVFKDACGWPYNPNDSGCTQWSANFFSAVTSAESASPTDSPIAGSPCGRPAEAVGESSAGVVGNL